MKIRLLKIFFASTLITILIFIISVLICAKGNFPTTVSAFLAVDMVPILDYYSSNIRGSLFAGLISVGGFLMTGKTFILVTMKQNVFDDDKYIINFKKMEKYDSGLKRYQPLIELKDILYVAVFITIISAIVQLTVGLLPHWSAALVAIFFAIFSVILVVDSLNLIKKNLDFWLKEE